ncbi:MAG: hypothetical protein IJX74_07140 [Clostridia bacterium]|nr:hypothetical protein [Clostridia bacterium]
MKIKNAAVNSLIYFLYFFGACLITMLAEALLLKIIDKFVILPYLTQTVMRIVIYSAAVPALVSLLGYFEGYREARFNAAESAVSCVFAIILHSLFAMLFNFQAFITGAVRFTAGLIHNGSEITYENMMSQTPYSLFLLIFLAYGALYSLLLMFFKYYGAKKRISDRRELTGE